MRKYLFRCKECQTIMTIETDLEDKYIHQVPPCPCGRSRMLNMATPEYAYGIEKQFKVIHEIPQSRSRFFTQRNFLRSPQNPEFFV